MKNIYLNCLAVNLVVLCCFINIQSLRAQPWPDNNFCVVAARLIQNDSVCIVGGHGPLVFNYDDGTADNYFSWVFPNAMVAVKYKPPGYPLRIISGSIYVGDGSFPEGADFIGTDMRIIIFDDDGSNNLPGTVLDSVTITVDNFEWVIFDGLNTIIEDGEFFIAMEQLNSPPSVAPVGVDETSPTVYKSYIKPPDGEWKSSAYNDFMIRAFTCDTQFIPRDINHKNYIWFELARMSDFDPDKGEKPEDGIIHIIDSLSYFYYQDTLFYSLPPGYYAYAVRKISENIDTTGWYYTNVLFHQVSSVDEFNLSSEVNIYPNPVSDELKITDTDVIKYIEVFNLYGERVFSSEYNEKEIVLKTNLLKRGGIYIIRVKTGNGVISKKILKI